MPRKCKKIAKTAAELIRVVSFNIANDGRFGLPGVIQLLRETKADLIGLQESEQVTGQIAESLGYRQNQRSGHGALLTRLDIESATAGGEGIVVRTGKGRKLSFFNKHLFYKPYGPFQILHIPYEDGRFVDTAEEAIEEAVKARGAGVKELLTDANSVNVPPIAQIAVGDYNEPSYRDWTDAAAKAGRHPIKVAWPSTKALADAGFKDAYREMYPDEMSHPGNTWTPLTKPDDPKDHHDRIDFVMYRGPGIRLKSIQIIGEDAHNSDIVFTPFPSDHRALLAVFEVYDEQPATPKNKVCRCRKCRTK